MKQSPVKSKPKKKRRSKVTQRNLPGVSVLSSPVQSKNQRRKCRRRSKRARTSVLHNLDYVFNTSEKVKKELTSIKRVIQNNGPEQVKSRPSCSRYWKVNRRCRSGRFKNDVEWSNNCTKNFLRTRTFKIDNPAMNSNKYCPGNISITLEQMLNIRKKRLRNKYQKTSQGKVESSPPLVNQKPMALSCEGNNGNNNNISAISVEPDLSFFNQGMIDLISQDNNQNSIEIATVDVEFHPQFVNQEVVDLSKQHNNLNNNEMIVPMEKTDPSMNNDVICTDANTINVQRKKMDIITHDYIPIEDSVMDDTVLEVPININLEEELDDKFADHSVIITSVSEREKPFNVVDVITEEPIVIKLDDEHKESKETNSIDDDSVIIICDSNKETHDDRVCNNNEVRKLLRNNSVITIPDSTDDNNDNDVICITENSSKNKTLNEESSVIIVDDDDDDENLANGARKSLAQIKEMNLRSSFVNSKKMNVKLKRLNNNNNNNNNNARKSQTKKRVKKRVSLLRRASAIINELASCANVNCINAPNRRRTRRSKNLSCACKNTENIVTPNLSAISEEPKTVALQHGIGNNHTLINHGAPLQNRKRNSAVSNIYNTRSVVRQGLREIILDASNIALGHSNGRFFSVRGLHIAINYFIKRGHKVTAFVPQYRQKYGQCSEPDLLKHLAEKRHVIFTPSREVDRRRITPYDDRYIIQYATACEGIVVSNDNFRDLLHEKREWRETIEKRILMYTWVDDVLMFPDDPLGRRGPNLTRFLKFP